MGANIRAESSMAAMDFGEGMMTQVERSAKVAKGENVEIVGGGSTKLMAKIDGQETAFIQMF
jgi:ABC-type molybdate transport system substrate-binding protein